MSQDSSAYPAATALWERPVALAQPGQYLLRSCPSYGLLSESSTEFPSSPHPLKKHECPSRTQGGPPGYVAGVLGGLAGGTLSGSPALQPQPFLQEQGGGLAVAWGAGLAGVQRLPACTPDASTAQDLCLPVASLAQRSGTPTDALHRLPQLGPALRDTWGWSCVYLGVPVFLGTAQ